MKYVTYTLLSLSILFNGCSLFNKDDCVREDVKVGEYLLIDASITDLARYENMEQLTFRDSVGNDLILTQTRFAIHTEVPLRSKFICSAGDDISFAGVSYRWEYFDTESWHIVYKNGENRLDFNLSIDGERDDDRNLLLDKLYDKVSYTYWDGGGAHQGIIKIEFVVNDRQNSISADVLSQPEVVHFDQIEINGQVYEDVWSYNREDPTGIVIPVLYVKQGVGILAFVDDDGTLWNLVN